MAEVLFGIDFGACNLKCVKLQEKKISGVRLNVKDDGSYHMPNAIYYSKNKDGEIQKVIGQAALNMGDVEQPENLVVDLKRKLEQKNWRQFIPALNREVTAPEVVEDIFKKIYDMATRNISKDDVARAAITVPVIFTKNQRQIIIDAATKVGFKVDGTINEAFATIFAVKNQKDSFNLVFDLGGSTLDVSVIKIDGNEIHELAAAGIKLGGLDIDRDILEKILKPKYESILNAAWDFENNDSPKMNFVRELKESIYLDEFSEEICGEDISCKKDFDKIILSRAEVDELLEREGYREKIIDLLDELFDTLGEHDDCFDKSDVTQIWAVGGSLQIPYFRTLLEDYFGTELFDAQDYDFEDVGDFLNGLDNKYLAVACGAANFLKKRETVTTINAIPYRICFKVGKNLRQGLAKNLPAGFETLYLPLKLSELDAAGWKIELYQTFGDEANFDDAAYLDSVQLDSALYDKKDSPLLKLKMMRDGRLRLRIGEQRTFDDESEFVLLEQHFLELEG
ncbi:MAG: Hsp70 family protein [Selenomonadaceae bacterium]|nr:Hsp70 family protein [Selenomonadaceae bacterium]